MFSIINKKNSSIIIFLFINFLFGLKYLSRITDYYLLGSIIICLMYIFLFKSYKLLKKHSKHLIYFNLFLLVTYVFAFAFIFKKIPPESLNVDRWSVITSFWDNFFKGEFVYFALSHMGNPPGPMPFYFILALPFYMINELGYFSLLGVISFYFLLRYTQIDIKKQTIAILIIMCSLFYLWEVICRSNIFLNSTIILFVLVFYFKSKSLTFNNTKFIFNGILIGLAISTRNVLVIPFIIAFVYELKNEKLGLIELSKLGIIIVFVFVLTFLPFTLNHFEEFKTANPFIIQSSALMPFKLTIAFILIGFLFGYLSKSERDVYYFAGLNLFLTIIGYYVFHILKIGFHKTFFNSVADISYFILCLPFFMFYLAQEKNKFL